MKRLFLLPLLVLAAASVHGADGAFVARAYRLPYEAGCFNGWPKENSGEGWREFLSELGVEWPEGSSIRHSLHFDSWVVRNTEENHARIRDAIRPLSCPPPQVRVQVHFCAFTPEAFEALDLSETVGTSLDPAAWKALRKRILATGGAEVLGCPAVVARNGAEFSVKADEEYCYPTDFDVELLDSPETPSCTNAQPRHVAAVVVPTAFERREVGQIVHLIPMVSPDLSRISLDLTPWLVFPPAWRDYGSPVLGGAADPVAPKMEVPFFPVVYVSDSLDLRPGDTAALGGAALDRPGSGRRFFVFFVTASLAEAELPVLPDPPTPDPSAR